MQETLVEQPKEEKVLPKYSREEIHEATLTYFNGDNLATEVWINKYCLKDSAGNLYEKTPDDMHWRLAKELARIELKYENPLFAEEIYEKIKHFKKIVPQGSPMSGIGNDFQIVSISNCFVIGNENEADSYGGIFKLDQEIAQLQKRRAGVGVDLSFIRPEGSPVKNSALTSTGIVPFMERFSNTTREVAQDGRRGALMESISIKHPDAEAFIDAKLDGTKVTGANISIKIDNDFMEAATQGTTYTQQYPINSKNPTVTKEVNASKIWKKIIHNAWDKAEPGILFWDTLIEESVPDCYADLGFESISTNPCLTLDSKIMTKEGSKSIETLIGKKFIAIVDGIEYPSTDEGFFMTKENSDVFEIKTNKGFTIKGTDNHEFKQVLDLSRDNKEFKWTMLKEFQNGDLINLNNNIGVNWEGNGNFDTGWLLGSLLGDGTFDEKNAILRYWGVDRKESKKNAVTYIKSNLKHREDIGKTSNNNFEIEQVKSVELKKLANSFGLSNNKTLTSKIEDSSSSFYKGFLCGWFDADGTVNDNIEKGINVRLASSILGNLYFAQKMLASIGIISTVYENRREEQYKEMPDGKGGYKLYKTKSQHELSISKDNILIFQKEINFSEKTKSLKLENCLSKLNRGLYRERFVDSIVSIEYVGNENVYDCQIPYKNEFDANGISTHNCGEIPLCANDSCRLLAINLFGYVINPFTDEAYFDWNSFIKDVRIAEKLMDDIIDLELEKIDKIIAKIDSDPEDAHIREAERNLWISIKDKAERGRRTGLGITAEGDMLAALGFKYGTDKGNKFSEEVHKVLKLEAFRSSVYMGKDRGAFPMYDSKREENNPFILRIKDEDPDLYNMMVKYGRRNLALLTIAPTGTVSIMTQTTSGIEPVFLVSYKRRRKINPNDKNIRVDFTDELGDTWMEYPVFHHKFKLWLEINGYNVEEVESMSSDEIDDIIKVSPYYGATSNDVDWVKKVEMQGMVQKHIDHSISVTVNLPNDVSEETVAKVYEAGWKHGCKGITVYRDGSRSGVLVSESEKKKQEKDKLFKDNHAPKRPKRLKAEIVRFQNNLEKWIGVVGMLDGRPYEVFTGRMQNGLSELPNNLVECEVVKNRNEEGEKRYDIEYLDSDGNKQIHTGLNHTFNQEYWNYAKMISSVLRHGMPIIYVLDLIQSLNLNDEHLNTWKNGVARVMKKYIKDGEKGNGTCPNCGSENLEYKEGCLTCMSCGNSKCG